MPKTIMPFALDAKLEITVDASAETCFKAVLHELGPGMVLHDGQSMQMKLEAFPGGRWFRDFGDEGGHLWGHVQVIKPPRLIEFTGPMFMSYPAVNFIAIRVAAESDNRCNVSITHQAIGPIEDGVKNNVGIGWNAMLQGIKEYAENN